MNRVRGLLIVCIAAGLAPGSSIMGANEPELVVGGSLTFEFGDADISTVPGPKFGTEEKGSVADINLSLRNRRVQAGVTLSLAQGSENVTSIGTDDEVPFPLDNAYIRLSDLFGLLRMNLRLRGKETSLGTIAVTGTNPDPVEGQLDYRASDGMLTLDVERGVLGNVYLGVAANQITGRAATPTAEAIEHIWGVKGLTGYEGELIYGYLDIGVLNTRYPTETFVTEAELGGFLFDWWDLTFTGETTMIGPAADTFAIGGGGEMAFTVAGFTPKASVFAKNRDYGRDEDLLKIANARDDFNTRSGNQELGWDANLSYRVAQLWKSNLLTLRGGYNTIVTGVQRDGWSAGFDLNFYEFGELPLTGGFSIGQYGDEGLGVFGNDDLLWSSFLSYNYFGLEVKAELGRKIYKDPLDPGSGNRNSAVGYLLSARVFF